jgi:hypothetical protein
MQTLIERIAAARSAEAKAATELWNIRLELLSRSSDLEGIIQLLRTPIELAGDNCSCNSACNVCVNDFPSLVRMESATS